MKKTINIHLGGMPFIIDEDAYNILHHYIESLKAKFANENERNEIIADIESRVAEVFSARLDKRQVVDENDVNFIIAQLGNPEDIAGASESESASQSQQQATTTNTNKTFSPRGEKKLFRDTDNSLLGGVISGLCQYFGYNEPIWARLIFALLLWFSFGTFILVYLILWLLVPEAKTRAEKLQMRGEPVTIDTLEKEMRETMNRTTDMFNRTVNDDNIGGKIITILLLLLKGFLKIVAVIIFIVCIFMLIAFLAAVFGFSMLGLPAFAPLTQLFVDSHFTYIIALVAGVLAVGIPLFSVMYSSAKFVLSNKVESNKYVSATLTVLWIIALLTLFVIGGNAMKNFDQKETVREELSIIQPQGSALYIASMEDSTSEPFFASSNVGVNGIKRSENGFVFGTTEFELKPSKDDLFRIEKNISAYGKSKADARKTIGLINYRYLQTDSTVSLSPNIEVFKNAKFRKQEVKTVIYVPVGKKLVFADENLTDFNIGDETFYAGELANKAFVVKEGKIVCENCDTLQDEDDIEDDAQIAVGSDSVIVHAKKKKEAVNISITSKGVKVEKHKSE